MRTVVAGSRLALAVQTYEAIEAAPWRPTVVISGMARGADKAGALWARENDVPVEEHPADWSEFGRSAGHIRNAEMAAAGEALILVWDGDQQRCKGSYSMLKLARKRGLTIYEHIVDLVRQA